jgi:hypothetical protein
MGQSNKPQLTPLSGFEFLFFSVLLFFTRGSKARTILKKRREYRLSLIKRRKQLKQAVKEVNREATNFATIIQHRLVALGEAWVPREYDPLAVIMPVRKRRRKHVQKVQFAQIRTTPERIFLQILVTKRGLFGARTYLPHRVTVGHLTAEETLLELSHACHRKIEAVADNYRAGAWYIVNRLEGLGGWPSKVMFHDMLDKYPADISRVPLVLGVGNPNRSIKTEFLAQTPHILIGGSTGGGKSNMVNGLILQLMYFFHPKDLKFTLIDLKDGMEFSSYRESPHLAQEIVMSPEGAHEILKNMVNEIKRRNQIMRGNAKELSIWNEMYPDQAMPRLIVIVDEFAQLVLNRGKDFKREIQDLVSDITSLGRAVGVHMIISTQYPIKEIVSTLIKANAALKIAFKMQNAIQSSVIINVGDAAYLPDVKGRMAYVTEAKTNEVQTPFVTPDDIKHVIRVAKGRAAGIISLAGAEPIIEPNALLDVICTRLEGSLAISKLNAQLRDYAISAQMIDDFVADIVKRKTVVIRGTQWQVTQRNGAYKLIADVSSELPAEVLAAVAESVPTAQQEHPAQPDETQKDIPPNLIDLNTIWRQTSRKKA